jgi:hypothetical protein
MLQSWILYKLKFSGDQEEMDALGISDRAIIFSLLTAFVHGIFEITLLLIEKRAYRASLLYYISVCLTGTFGWVPFTNLLKDGREDEVMPEHVFDYENISTRVFCLDFKYEYYFSEETLKNLSGHLVMLTNNLACKKRYKMRFGDQCLEEVTFT